MVHFLHILFLINVTATTSIYTISLHDALPISMASNNNLFFKALSSLRSGCRGAAARGTRSLCSACLTHWRTDRIAGWAAAHRRLGTPPDSELHARGELDRARLADRSRLAKRGRRTRRIDAGAEVAVHRDDVRPIRQVEYFEQG